MLNVNCFLYQLVLLAWGSIILQKQHHRLTTPLPRDAISKVRHESRKALDEIAKQKLHVDSCNSFTRQTMCNHEGG